MITYHPNQDIFKDPSEALVNPVNCVGVTGAGLAKDIRYRYPNTYTQYKRACDQGTLNIGRIMVCRPMPFLQEHPSYVVMFPTKYHWNDLSRLEYIEKGLASLRTVMDVRNFASISIPALGCGPGGLRWSDVRPMVEEHLKDVGDTSIKVYASAAV